MHSHEKMTREPILSVAAVYDALKYRDLLECEPLDEVSEGLETD